MTRETGKKSALPRVAIIIFLVVQFSVLLSWAPLGKGDLNPYLKAIGVVPLHVPFGDFRTISAGIPFYEAGEDPYTDGRYDFMGREFNYPPIWLKLSFLGVSPEAVSYVYFAFATLFSIALLLLFWRTDYRYWYLCFLFIFSPPILLAMERCNNDLLMFFLIVTGIWIGRNSVSKVQNWLCGTLLLIATILKVFPVFAYIIFLKKNWKSSFLFLGPFGVICAAYFVSIKPVLGLIKQNTPWSLFLSFGVNVVPKFFSKTFPDILIFQGSLLLILAWVIAAVGIFLGYWIGKRALPSELEYDYNMTLFRAGGAIYVAVFLLGSSYDYRLMFLLLTLPFVFRTVFYEGVNRTFFVSYLIAMAVAFWVNEASAHLWFGGSLTNVGLLLNEAANWVLFIMIVTTQFQLLPAFVRSLIYKDSELSRVPPL